MLPAAPVTRAVEPAQCPLTGEGHREGGRPLRWDTTQPKGSAARMDAGAQMTPKTCSMKSAGHKGHAVYEKRPEWADPQRQEADRWSPGWGWAWGFFLG